MSSCTQVLRVSAYALIVENGRILLCRLSSTTDAEGSWTLPGGGLEFGEHPEQAVVREVTEETGYDFRVSELAAVDNFVFESPERQMQALRFIYRGEITGGNMRAEKQGSTDECRWMTLKETWKLPLVNLARYGIELAFPECCKSR